MADKRTKIEFLDTLLSTRKHYTQEEIIQRFEERFNESFSRRSFFNYIKEMRKEGAPIEHRTEKDDFGSKTYYFYEESFNMNKTTLNRYDTTKINAALAVLQQFEHLPQMQDLSEIVLKLEQQTSLQAEKRMPTLFFDHKPHSSGVPLLRQLNNHILNREVIKLSYKPFPYDVDDQTRWKETGFAICVHPYFLKESKNLWYIFGLNHHKNTVENYALDRITNIEIVPNLFFKPNTQIDSRVYFDNIVGVTKFEAYPCETYYIKVGAIMSPYWVNRPLHKSQVLVEETPQYSVFSFDLCWNYEWQNLILSYSTHVEVLKPVWFRKAIRDVLLNASAVYV